MGINHTIPCGIKSGGGDLFGRYASGSIGFSPGWAGIFMLAVLLLLALLCCCCWCCNLMLVIKRWCCDKHRVKGVPNLTYLENGNYFTATLPNNYVEFPPNLKGAVRFKSEPNESNYQLDSSDSHYYQSIDYDKIGETGKNEEESTARKEPPEENLYWEIDPIY